MDRPDPTYTPPSRLPSFEGFRILLAEDNFVNQEVVRGFLEGTSADLVVAKNGALALELFSQSDFDLVLMDVNMPVMDGLEATRALRNTAKGRSIPIVALTASATPEDAEQCYDVGMDAMMIKPIERMELLMVVAEQLMGRDEPTV